MSRSDGLCDLDGCDRKLSEAERPGTITSISSVSGETMSGPTDYYFCSEEHADRFAGAGRVFAWKDIPPQSFQRFFRQNQ